MLRILTAVFLSVAVLTLTESAPITESRLFGSSFAGPGNATFDYIVVGGGTAGLTIASRLAQRPSTTVAVIEAGTFYEIANSNTSQIPVEGPAGSGKSPLDTSPLIDWNFQTTPQAAFGNSAIHYARGKCLGGSSARNYLSYQRGTKESYRTWAEAVQDPDYEWDNFLPFFEKSLNFTPPDLRTRAANTTAAYDAHTLGNGRGPLSVTFGRYAQTFPTWVQLAFRQLGIQPRQGFTSGEVIGSSSQLLTIDGTKMTRESSETAFLQKIGLSNPNLMVYQSTMATQILFDDSKTATGVVIEIGGFPFVLNADREIVLSAGAFQSPQLLMVSGVGPAATLEEFGIPIVQVLEGVGKQMSDHILGGPSYRVNVETTSALSYQPFAAEAVESFLTSGTGMLASTGGDYLAFEKLPNSSRTHFTRSTIRDLESLPQDWPEVEYFASSAYYGLQENYVFGAPTDGFNYATIAVALAAPFSRGNLTISSSSMLDPPIINPNWLSHPTDKQVAVAGYKRARELFATSSMAPVLIGPEYFPGFSVLPENASDAEILEVIGQSFSSVSHASCTCKMGVSSDPMAVVDSHARVFGVQNLRVVDASSFAILPPGHPVATVYALAEKIAQNIIDDDS